MSRAAHAGHRSPTAILGGAEAALLRELDRVFTGWATEIGAGEIIPPPAYDVADLARLDVYRNFPHLSLVATPLDPDRAPAETREAFDPTALRPAQLGLSSATCYGAYLYFADSAVAPATTVTLANRCFRNEDHYEGLHRLASFQMREIVALGSWEHTQWLLSELSARITGLADRLSVPLAREAATDPFFRPDPARSVLQKLSPVKHEYQSDGLAIASVNTHRNFFGERCAITVDGGEGHAFTSCVAFGLERWVAVLTAAHHGDSGAALRRVRAIGGAEIGAGA